MTENAMNCKKDKPSILDELLEWLRPIFKDLVLAILLCTFIIKLANVSGPSMQPTLDDEERLILWSLCYQPKQGDIIAANCEGLNKVIVKRIVAVGGQTVTIDFHEGKVYVDGEEFLVDGIENVTTYYEGSDITELKVPDGKYFVLGDNRQDSNDSRNQETVGFIDREDILGKAVFRYYPLNRMGTLY